MNLSTNTHATPQAHPGMAFLLRASARFDLVEAGEMAIEDAIMGLAPAFYELLHPMCDCAREIYDRMEANRLPRKPRRRRR